MSSIEAPQQHGLTGLDAFTRTRAFADAENGIGSIESTLSAPAISRATTSIRVCMWQVYITAVDGFFVQHTFDELSVQVTALLSSAEQCGKEVD